MAWTMPTGKDSYLMLSLAMDRKEPRLPQTR